MSCIQYYGAPKGCSAASAAAVADDYTVVAHMPPTLHASCSSLEGLPPSVSQLASIRAVPAGLVGPMSRGSTRSGRGRRHRVKVPRVREGEIVAKFFNCAAGRPFPSNGLSLEQGITVEAMIQGLAFTSSNIAPTFLGQSFSATNFAVVSTYLSTFDQYRIDQLEYWLEPIAAPGALVPAALTSCVDLDDGNAPTVFGQVENHQGALQGENLAGRYHKWKPHMAVAVYSGAFTSFANEVAGWIDSASPNVQHYGIKAACGTMTAATGFSYTCRAVISFRSPSFA